MKKSPIQQAGEYTSLAFLLPAATFVGYGIGYLLDKAFGTHFLYLVFLLLGIISGLVQILRKVLQDEKQDGS